MRPNTISDLLRLVEADIADFEARMRAVVPAYGVGDRVELHDEAFEISTMEESEMPGYWLKKQRREPLFLPIDQEHLLKPLLH
jgi:hypothetical protein